MIFVKEVICKSLEYLLHAYQEKNILHWYLLKIAINEEHCTCIYRWRGSEIEHCRPLTQTCRKNPLWQTPHGSQTGQGNHRDYVVWKVSTCTYNIHVASIDSQSYGFFEGKNQNLELTYKIFF